MEIKEYLDCLIREDGIVLNTKTNEIVKGHINTFGDIVVNLGIGNEFLKDIVARLFFDFDINYQNIIKIGHLNFNKSDNSVDNLKVYSKKDKFNKSDIKVVLLAGDFLLFNRKDLVSIHKTLRDAFNNLLELHND